MLTEPKVAYCAEQPYAAIRTEVEMKDIPTTLPQLIPKVSGWLAKNNIAPIGAPFFQYLSIDNNNKMQVAVGFPIAAPIKSDDGITGGAFPAGNYATVTHIGDYKKLKETHMFMESWVEKNGLHEKKHQSVSGIEWDSRAEFYITDPSEISNPDNWKTDVVFLLT
jgi:effector-binding domain-containing protein